MMIAVRSRPGWQFGRKGAILALSAAALLAGPPPCPAERPSTASPPVAAIPPMLALSPVSAQFRSQAENALLTIPGSIWRQLDRAGWRIRLAEFVVDVDPSLTDDQPRGWPSGSSWENADAMNVPLKRLVVVSEKRRRESGEVAPNTRVAEVLRHEIGHAFDMVTGGDSLLRSSRADFVKAYRQDIQKIHYQNRSALKYYLQNDTAGRQEAFAEAFAIILGGGSDSLHRDHFVQSFPRVMKLVQGMIKP